MAPPPSHRVCVPKDALSSLDRINAAIVESLLRDDLLNRVLDEILDIFDCERAWMIRPGPQAPDVPQFVERCRPGFEGSLTPEGGLPDDVLRALISITGNGSGEPTRFDPETDQHEFDRLGFPVRQWFSSQLAMPLSPHCDHLWVLGLHHCVEPMIYQEVSPLFSAIGKRISAGLTNQIAITELRTNEQRYRAMVDHATEAILIHDVDADCYIEANPAAERLFGLPIEKLTDGVRSGELSAGNGTNGGQIKEIISGYIKQALAGGFPNLEWNCRHANGSVVPCHVTLGRFPDPTRNLVRISFTDITQLKQAQQHKSDLEDQLAQAQKLEMIGQMSGGVAHDFNNLLSVILGNLELLQETVECPEQHELIDAAIKATMRGADLTRKMLSFARRARLEPRVMDLTTVLQEMKNWMQRTLPATISVRQSLPMDLWQVEADPASTESAILNLVVNSRDAMPDGGVMTIEAVNYLVKDDLESEGRGALVPGSYVMLAISDTGTGIPPDQLNKVFEPFFTTKNIGEGSGLGLSMVHGFMKQSGGAVRIYSEPGQGTTVKLFFRTPEQEQAAPADPVQEKSQRLAKGVRVLFAEDEEEVSIVLARILRTAGFQVFAAPSGDAAVKLFASAGPFDLLVTDIVMPGNLQGPALARALRQVQPRLPVVFLSGYAREAARHVSGLQEDDLCLMKPVTRTELLDAVHKAVSAE